MKSTLRCIFCILAGSIAAILVISLNGCGNQAQTKQFFDEACKGYKTSSVSEPVVTAIATPTPEPTPPDYDNRCSEDDKKQILADQRAATLRFYADQEQKGNQKPTAAEMAVDLERTSKQCQEASQCSGLPLEVIIPPGYDHYHCGMMTGGNFTEIQCSKPDEKGLFN